MEVGTLPVRGPRNYQGHLSTGRSTRSRTLAAYKLVTGVL